MLAPSTLLMLAATYLGFADGQDEQAHAKDAQRLLKSPQERAKILAACPAYEHYARFPQYVSRALVRLLLLTVFYS